MCDYRQSVEYCQYYINKGWRIEKVKDTNILIKKIPVFGNVIKIQRFPTELSPEDIEEFATKHKAILIAIEPDINTTSTNYNDYNEELKKRGYRDFNMFLSPTKTSCLDISASEEEILEGFDHDIKKSIRLNLNRPVSYLPIDTIDKFYPILFEAEHRGHIFLQNFKDWKKQWGPFGSQISILVAKLNGKILGGNMFIIGNPVSYGLFLPVTKLGKEMRISASLIWEGIKIAKKSGSTIFDLNGLYDERYNSPKNWQGLSAFKKKFNGHELSYMRPKYKILSKYLKPFEKLGLLWVFLTDL